MALNIDTGSEHLNLGAHDNAFNTAYLPAPTPPDICNLPTWTLPTLTLSALPPIDATCKFTFPGVVPIPPIYNPPIIIPPACESFTGVVNITMGSGIAGNLSISSTDVPECGFSLDGNIDVNVCEDFTAEVDITAGGAASGSHFEVATTGIPHCGFKLTGDITVNPPPSGGCYSVANDVTMSEGTAITITNTGYSVVATSDSEGCTLFTLNGDSSIALSYSAGGASTVSGCDVSYSEIALGFTETGALTLTGNLPVPCFNCLGTDHDFAYSNISLTSVSLQNLSFNDGCTCNNTNAYWNSCGNVLNVANSSSSYTNITGNTINCVSSTNSASIDPANVMVCQGTSFGHPGSFIAPESVTLKDSTGSSVIVLDSSAKTINIVDSDGTLRAFKPADASWCESDGTVRSGKILAYIP